MLSLLKTAAIASVAVYAGAKVGASDPVMKILANVKITDPTYGACIGGGLAVTAAKHFGLL
jgi:hypothetical protein